MDTLFITLLFLARAQRDFIIHVFFVASVTSKRFDSLYAEAFKAITL